MRTGRQAGPIIVKPKHCIGRGFLIVTMGAALWAAATSVIAQQGVPTAAGLWEKRNQSAQPEGWFRIAERDGVYEGQIVKMFPKPGEDVAAWRCTRCEGEQKNAPVLGITFIKGMRRNGLRYENGTILDPRDGATYDALMEVSADGQSLVVRGYLGIPLLGQSEVWYRLPDDALETSKPSPGKRAPVRGGRS
jgi:uncharacterized protein (DUF2147 family)